MILGTVQLYDSYSIIQFLDDVYPHRYQLIPNSTLNPIKKVYAIQIVQMIRISMNVYHNAADQDVAAIAKVWRESVMLPSPSTTIDCGGLLALS